MKISKVEIANLKAKWGKIYTLSVKKNNKTYTALVRKPDIEVMSACESLGENRKIDSAILAFNSCVLMQDEGIAKDDEIKLNISTQLQGLFKSLEVEIKEL